MVDAATKGLVMEAMWKSERSDGVVFARDIPDAEAGRGHATNPP
jgi:hypothetical protein